jgi:hypothetical protein
MVDKKELYPVLNDVDLDKEYIKKGLDNIRKKLPRFYHCTNLASDTP